ncbi:hypothetical protein TH0335_03670 [Helicobacter pylori]
MVFVGNTKGIFIQSKSLRKASGSSLITHSVIEGFSFGESDFKMPPIPLWVLKIPFFKKIKE